MTEERTELSPLIGAGVDNLSLYPANITFTTTGEWHEVFGFNLVGLVSVVDFRKSNITSSDGDFMMDSSIGGFEVDPKKARDLSMFRLAENCMTVLVHQRIKDAVDRAGINAFSFVEPKNWVQL